MSVDPVRDAYATASALYIGLFGSGGHEHPDDRALMKKHLAGLDGTVLDLGCGPGHHTAYLHSCGADVVGVDMVPEFVAHARIAHPGVRFRLGSMRQIEEQPAAGILSWYSLIHVEPADVDGVLATWRRALLPGGRLVIGFFDGDAVEAFDHKVVTAYRWPAPVMSERLAEAGFTELERVRRPGDGAVRAQAAIAAVAR